MASSVPMKIAQTESQIKKFLTIIKYIFPKYAGTRQNDCVVITQNFVSRQQLMECIAKLNFLNSHWPTGTCISVQGFILTSSLIIIFLVSS